MSTKGLQANKSDGTKSVNQQELSLVALIDIEGTVNNVNPDAISIALTRVVVSKNLVIYIVYFM